MNWKMTKWQRGILLGMYLVSCRAQNPRDVWFTRRALEFLMWFDWQGSHTRKMGDLITHKWVEKSENMSGVIIYRMTAAAHGQLSVDYSNAMACTHVAPEQDKLF